MDSKSYLFPSLNAIKTDWKKILKKYDFNKINKFLTEKEELYDGDLKMYPPKPLIFNCFNFFNVADTKVVILGQDPYIREGEAMGLSFSVPSTSKVPPSLKNIYKEINRSMEMDMDIPLKKSGDLTHWAQQGVLLLNCALTVIEGKSGSHGRIWLDFSEFIIKAISDSTNQCIFMLWGNYALGKVDLIDSEKHLVLKAGHPSPLNRKKNFEGNNHFLNANEHLEANNRKAIDWSKIKYANKTYE